MPRPRIAESTDTIRTSTSLSTSGNLPNTSEPRSTAARSCRILRNRGCGHASAFLSISSRWPGSCDPFSTTPTIVPHADTAISDRPAVMKIICCHDSFNTLLTIAEMLALPSQFTLISFLKSVKGRLKGSPCCLCVLVPP